MAGSDDRWRKWDQTRRMGRTRFVWLVGVLWWGLTTGLIWSGLVWHNQPAGEPFWPFLVASLFLFPAGGYGFGAVMWRVNERGYAAHRERVRV